MCIISIIITYLILSFTLHPCTTIIIKSQFISLNNPTPLSTNAYILTPICLGNTHQHNCFPLILDINNKNTIIFSQTAHPHGIDPSSLLITNITNTEGSIWKYDTCIKTNTCYTNIIFDSSHILYNTKLFIASSLNIDITNTNYLGYLSLSCSEVIGEGNSLLQQLTTQNVTSSRNYGYTFTSQNEVNVFIDEHITNEVYNEYTFCKPGMRIGLIEANIYCRMDMLSYGTSHKQIQLPISNSMHVLFATRTEYMQGCTEGNDIFTIYITASHNNCYTSEDKNKGTYLTCNNNVNINELPDIYFGIKGTSFELVMKAIDIFDITTGTSRLYVKRYCNFWVFDMNILKRYDIYIDYEQSLIGFKANFIFDDATTTTMNNIYKLLISIFKLNIYIIIFGLIIISITTHITKHNAHC